MDGILATPSLAFLLKNIVFMDCSSTVLYITIELHGNDRYLCK